MSHEQAAVSRTRRWEMTVMTQKESALSNHIGDDSDDDSVVLRGRDVISRTPPRVRWQSRRNTNPESRKTKEMVEHACLARAENPKKPAQGLTAWQGQQSYPWCHPAIGGITCCQVSGGPQTVAAS